METPGQELNHQARAYFLQQGQSISKLNEILTSNILVHHLRKWFSVIMELLLYCLFAAIIIIAVCIPTDISAYYQIDEYNRIGAIYQNDDFAAVMAGIKLLIIIISLPVLLFAILLGRNRKKNNLIHEAFGEVKKMKEEFDRAVKELQL